VAELRDVSREMRTVSENSTPSFEELVGELGGQLSGYLTKMVGNRADADDLLQETLLRIATNLSGFEHRSSLKTWAFRIATNVAIDFLRKSKRAELTEIDEAGTPSNLDEEDDLVLVEMNQCVRDVIDSLPPNYRAPLVLHALDGKSMAEVAEVCDISVTAAKVRVHRAKARLRDALNQGCDFYQNKNGNLRCDPKGPCAGS
jgi:RNA polymerase sigma-70 factor (ECF subfamily)